MELAGIRASGGSPAPTSSPRRLEDDRGVDVERARPTSRARRRAGRAPSRVARQDARPRWRRFVSISRRSSSGESTGNAVGTETASVSVARCPSGSTALRLDRTAGPTTRGRHPCRGGTAAPCWLAWCRWGVDHEPEGRRRCARTAARRSGEVRIDTAASTEAEPARAGPHGVGHASFYDAPMLIHLCAGRPRATPRDRRVRRSVGRVASGRRRARRGGLGVGGLPRADGEVAAQARQGRRRVIAVPVSASDRAGVGFRHRCQPRGVERAEAATPASSTQRSLVPRATSCRCRSRRRRRTAASACASGMTRFLLFDGQVGQAGRARGHTARHGAVAGLQHLVQVPQ